MQFRLVYQGPLPSGGNGSNKAAVKQAIRKQFDPQLRELWRTHPFLKSYLEIEVGEQKFTDWKSSTFAFCGYRFLPLIGRIFGNFGDDDKSPTGLACALNILFLRRDHPNSIVHQGGDIDNRVKVILDALQVPHSCSGIASPTAGEDDLIYCLLEDDKLITEINISTDQLLVSPPSSGHPNQYAHVIIHVKTIVMAASGYTAFMT